MSLVLVNQPGPLPISVPVNWPSTNTVLVAISGSAYTPTAGSTMIVKVGIHGTYIGDLRVAVNSAGTHVAFPDGFFAINGDFGDTTLTLTAANGATVTDKNDTFTVALIY